MNHATVTYHELYKLASKLEPPVVIFTQETAAFEMAEETSALSRAMGFSVYSFTKKLSGDQAQKVVVICGKFKEKGVKMLSWELGQRGDKTADVVARATIQAIERPMNVELSATQEILQRVLFAWV